MDDNIGRTKKKIFIFSSIAMTLFAFIVGMIKIAGSEKMEDITADINGEWLITDVIESSSYKSYIGLSIDFKMVFRQIDKEFTADGKKYRENGRELPASQRTPIFIKGTIDGNTVRGNIIEHGKKHDTAGQFTWSLVDDNKMVGKFTSEAANSAGSSIAIRVRNPPS